MAFYNKLKWILGILIIFVLILATNLIDRNNFIKVKNSMDSLYQDRLVVKGLIFDMNNLIHAKQIAVVKNDKEFYLSEDSGVDKKMANLINQFEGTLLTENENKLLNDFQKGYQSLDKIERQYKDGRIESDKVLETKLNELQVILEGLSEIQLKEGKRQISISKRAVDTVKLYTQIEIYFLLFLAIIIQIIVIYKPKNQ